MSSFVKKVAVNEAVAAVRFTDWSETQGASLCVMCAGSPSVERNVEASHLNAICNYAVEKLSSLEDKSSTGEDFFLQIECLFGDCERFFSHGFFVSIGIAARLGRNIYVATVGDVESWYSPAQRLERLTEPTTIGFPGIPMRVFSSVLGIGHYPGLFNSAVCKYPEQGPIFLMAAGNFHHGLPVDIASLAPFLSDTATGIEFSESMRRSRALCIV